VNMHAGRWALAGGLLLSDEKVTWRGRPARLLVIRPALLEPDRKDEPAPFVTEAKVWLDESGVPLAMESVVAVN